jgi:hypothetical protein
MVRGPKVEAIEGMPRKVAPVNLRFGSLENGQFTELDMPGKFLIEERVDGRHVLSLAKSLKEAHRIHIQVLYEIEVGLTLVVHSSSS